MFHIDILEMLRSSDIDVSKSRLAKLSSKLPEIALWDIAVVVLSVVVVVVSGLLVVVVSGVVVVVDEIGTGKSFLLILFICTRNVLSDRCSCRWHPTSGEVKHCT